MSGLDNELISRVCMSFEIKAIVNLQDHGDDIIGSYEMVGGINSTLIDWMGQLIRGRLAPGAASRLSPRCSMRQGLTWWKTRRTNKQYPDPPA